MTYNKIYLGFIRVRKNISKTELIINKFNNV